nr:MAG TPA: hypothetical protein [Caudoviricetes sp.]
MVKIFAFCTGYDFNHLFNLGIITTKTFNMNCIIHIVSFLFY